MTTCICDTFTSLLGKVAFLTNDHFPLRRRGLALWFHKHTSPDSLSQTALSIILFEGWELSSFIKKHPVETRGEGLQPHLSDPGKTDNSRIVTSLGTEVGEETSDI